MVIKSVLVCAAVFALLTLAFPGAAGVQVIAVAAVCVTAGLAALQSLSDGHYGWFSAFLAMAVLLNPIGPVSLTSTPTLALLGIGLAILTSGITMVRGALPSRAIAQTWTLHAWLGEARIRLASSPRSHVSWMAARRRQGDAAATPSVR